jgi:hypothetical protein
MSDFLTYLAPWLIMAVALSAAIVLGLKLMPTDQWAEGIIRGWADSQGLGVTAIDDAPWLDLIMPSTWNDARWSDLLMSSTCKAYRVCVMDRKGCERACKAVVGRFLLGRTHRNISITWIKAQ